MDASTAGIVAVAAGAVALVALGLAARLTLALRRVRTAQRAVLGTLGAQDLVAYTAGLAEMFGSLQDHVEEIAARLDARLGTAEALLGASISYAGLVRYDAMNEMSGRQSTSIALLDSHLSGIVLSSIHHRDQARMYAKLVREGRGELELSPEEAEAVRQAVADAGPGTS